MSTQSDSAVDDIALSFNDQEIIPDPYPTYSRLREGHGACLLPLFDGAWLFFRYRDVKRLLRDSRLSNDRTSLPVRTLPLDQRAQFGEMTQVMSEWVGMKDPPEHTPLRRHLNNAVGHLDNASLKDHARPFVDRLIRRIPEGETVDLIGELAYPLPSLVISDLIGAPHEDHLHLAGLADDLAYVFGSSTLSTSDVEQAKTSTTALVDYLRELAHRPDLPRHSLLYRLLSIRTAGAALTEDVAIAQCVLLLFAGLEPTRYAIGNAIHALAHHPDQMAHLRRDSSLCAMAVEELLRYDSPVQWVGRVAKESFSFEGFDIQQGQVVFPYIAAANRDPERFDSPDELDIRRTPNRHLTFGQGSHHCLGAAMVRTQVRLVLRTLLSRFSEFRIDEGSTPIQWNSNLGFHGHRHLPVRFTA